MKTIVLITTGQPSGNPRIIKEADTLFNAGYDVLLLYCFFIDWATEKDEDLLKNVGWKYKLVAGTPTKNKWQYNFTRVKFKIAKVLNKYFGNSFGIGERSQARAYDELLNEAKKIKADWYIGHNLGTLAVVSKAAMFNNAKAGFDFEDYHRAEVEFEDEVVLNRTKFLENKYLPFLQYYSAASDLILLAVKSDHPNFGGKSITLYNSFPLRQLNGINKIVELPSEKLNLFWFSQTIGLNRGLENVLEALKIINDRNISLTLAGRCDDLFKKYIDKNVSELKNNIHYVGIIPPDELPKFSAQFDVGLAVELSKPYNRDICLTNKVFTYILAGNAIIFSGTSAQEKFNKENNVGIVFMQNDISELVGCINFYRDFNNLQNQKVLNRQLAVSKFNWELESNKLLQIID